VRERETSGKKNKRGGRRGGYKRGKKIDTIFFIIKFLLTKLSILPSFLLFSSLEEVEERKEETRSL